MIIAIQINCHFCLFCGNVLQKAPKCIWQSIHSTLVEDALTTYFIADVFASRIGHDIVCRSPKHTIQRWPKCGFHAHILISSLVITL